MNINSTTVKMEREMLYIPDHETIHI